MEHLTNVFNNEDTVMFLVPIVAIVVAGIIAIVVLRFRHLERLAMIEKGIHPDHPPEKEEDDPAELFG